MKITTKQFGEIEFSEDMLIKFENGIIGFENYRNYLLINTGDDFFLWLTSVDEPEIVFPLFSANALMDEFPLEKNCEPFCIVTLNKDPRKITANLKSPVYICQEEKKGFQKILDEEEYAVDYTLFIEN